MLKRVSKHIARLAIISATLIPIVNSRLLGAPPATSEKIRFFERKIRPALVAHCYECHSTEARANGKLKGGLLLDSREGIRAGGDTGPAVVPGQVSESLLMESIRYGDDSYQMPPDGKLPAAVIADFEKWIAGGAADPRDAAATVTEHRPFDWDEARQFWSLKRPQQHEPPAVQNRAWVKSRIDTFVLARLEAAGLQPAPAANRETLLRRATFDLCGLPPTLDQQDRFLGDDSPSAFARLVDRLLASPRYGERWGRHWLDVARYAEDNTNMGPHNGPYKHAWRYRDWVIQAINEDVPYDRFILRQLATDFLPDTGPDDLAALGFQGLGPSYHKEVALAQVVLENRYADDWEDRVDAIGRGLLGLTLACARCHDHKYDPLTVEDYYAIAGVFASCRQTTRPVISAEEISQTQPLRDRAGELEKSVAAATKTIEKLTKEIDGLQKQLKVKPAAVAAKVTAAAGGEEDPAPESDPSLEKSRVRLAEAQRQVAKQKETVAAAKAEIAELKKTPGFEIPVANALTEEQVRVEEISKARMKIVYYPDRPRDLNIFIRGDAGRLGPLVRRRFLRVLSESDDQYFTNGSGRLELARAIASRDNPLTARVIVNRVWMHHFGIGLVDSPSNFGATGSRPTHPELLDDLTVRFINHGWSLKWLHREILQSATYQMQSSSSPPAADPDNRLLSHFGRHRLDAESTRDAILAVSGMLDRSIGGPSGDADDADFHRRAVYANVSRHKLSDTLQTFDFPDPAIHCSARAVTTTPLQQMFILNSPFMRRQTVALAQRICSEGGDSTESRIRFAYRLLFARQPTEAEVDIARSVIDGITDSGSDQPNGKDADARASWERYAHALLSCNEFIYVD